MTRSGARWSPVGRAGGHLILVISVAAILVGCGGGASVSPAPSVPPSPSPSGGPSTEPTASVVEGVPPELVEAILADLEARIGVDVSAATVVSAQQAIWPDGAMGCPKPGEVYIQVIVTGYQVIVEFDGTRYDYRVSNTGTVRFCGLAS